VGRGRGVSLHSLHPSSACLQPLVLLGCPREDQANAHQAGSQEKWHQRWSCRRTVHCLGAWCVGHSSDPRRSTELQMQHTGTVSSTPPPAIIQFCSPATCWPGLWVLMNSREHEIKDHPTPCWHFCPERNKHANHMV
jgi:hypothetical protein